MTDTNPRNPQKIALVIRNLAGRSGGAERVFCEQANFLAAEGYDVSCVVFDPPGEGPFFALDPRVELVQLAPIKPDKIDRALKKLMSLLPKPLALRDKVRWKLTNRHFIAQLGRYIDGAKPDVMISYLPPANTPLLFAARGREVRVVVTNHNVPKEDYTNPKRWGGGDYDRALRLSALDRADIIHVLFPKFGTWFPTHLQDRIAAIPNYISQEILDSKPTQEAREHLIIGVGRLAPVKNFAALLEAWGKLGAARGDWQVQIFGDGPQEKMLRARIKELGVADSFKLMGTTREIAAEYARAAIMCHPAEYEGFGLAPAEALACGTPVLAYEQTPGIDEFLTDDENAILVARSGDPIENLANGLHRLIEDETLRTRLGAHGPASVAKFDKAHHIRSWLNVIERAMGGASR